MRPHTQALKGKREAYYLQRWLVFWKYNGETRNVECQIWEKLEMTSSERNTTEATRRSWWTPRNHQNDRRLQTQTLVSIHCTHGTSNTEMGYIMQATCQEIKNQQQHHPLNPAKP